MIEGDLEKYWYINYWIWNIDRGKLQRKSISAGINEHDSKIKRREAANEIMNYINERLRNGSTTVDGTIKEFEERKKKEAEKSTDKKAKIDIRKITLLKAVDHFLTVKNAGVSQAQGRANNSMRKHIEGYLKSIEEENMLLIHFESNHAFEFSDYLLTEAEWTDYSNNSGGVARKGLAKKTHNNRKNDLKAVFTFYQQRFPKVITINPPSQE